MATSSIPPRTEDHCVEDFCIEEFCAEEVCTEDNPPEVELFITQMAFGLIQGMMTPEDIYEGMIEANCGDKEVAAYIRDRAVAEAREYHDTYGVEEGPN